MPHQTDAGARLRAVFLDIGGTIMQPHPSWEHVYAIALAEYGVEIEIEGLRAALRRAYQHGGWGFDDGFEPTEETSFRRTIELDRLALEELGVRDLPEAFYRRLAELFMLTSHWHVYPDTYTALDGLTDRGLVVGALSNWVWNLPELLHALDLVSHFDFIAASARVGFEKPHPEIFRHALAQAGVQPEEALHVGDHLEADVGGARRLGIGAVLIDRDGHYADAPVPDDVPVIRTLDGLLPIVDARLAGPQVGTTEPAGEAAAS
jgi:REG-2-like HAD superfamily hydrolase